MKNYITVESFGTDCPENWEDIAAFLNSIIEDANLNESEADDLWNKFWELADYNAENFRKVSRPDIRLTAASLYDGGWRKEDRNEIMKEYVLTADSMDQIEEYFDEFAAKENE